MNNTNDFENLEDERAKRRESKKKPRMRKHGQTLKKPSKRSALHIAKAEKKKKWSRKF